MKHISLVGFLALVAGSVGGFAFATGGHEERASRGVPVPDPDLGLAGGRAQLMTLTARLEERTAPVPVSPPSPLQDELAANTEAVRALVAELAELRRTLGSTGSRGWTAAPPAAAPLRDELWTGRRPDWLAWESVLSEWNDDPEAARQSLLLLTPAQLVARFGTPTRIRGEDDGAVKWCYWRERGPGTWDLRVTVTLRGDYVTALDVRAS